MGQTTIGTSNAQTKKVFAGALFNDAIFGSYWGSTFMAAGSKNRTPNTPMQLVTDLEKDDGDTVNYDLYVQLKGRPTLEDDNLEGNAEALRSYSDSITVTQVRHAVDAGGRMTRKRTVNDLRMIAKEKLQDWWSRLFDEISFMHLAGARGVNDDFIEPTTFTGYAGNSLTAPDSSHIVYGGSATSKATITNTDGMSLAVLDKVITKANTMGGGVTDIQRVVPLKMGNREYFVIVMHDFQEHALRIATGTGGWLDIQKSLATNLGNKSPIVTGALGEYRGAILHKHNKVVKFSDYGAGANLAAARASLMGRQALVAAFGSPGEGLRFAWEEKYTDVDNNRLVISTNTIMNVKRPMFNSKNVSSIAIDTYAVDPNA